MASIYKRGKSWALTWQEDGRQRRISLGRVSRQEAEAERLKKELELRGLSPPQLNAVRLEDFIEAYLDWFQTHYPDSYARTYQIVRDYILPEFIGEPIEHIGDGRVSEYVAARQAAGAAQTTVLKEWNTLVSALNWARRERLIREFYVTPKSKPQERRSKPPVIYTKDELERLYAFSPYHHLIWRFYANTGLRAAEGLRAKKGDVVGGALLVKSESTSPTKSRKWRRVPLNEQARWALGRMKVEGDWLIPHIDAKSLSRRFRVCARRAGLDGSLHSLRHTFCSHLLASGVPLLTVQKLAGHASISTTERYLSLLPGALDEGVTRIAL